MSSLRYLATSPRAVFAPGDLLVGVATVGALRSLAAGEQTDGAIDAGGEVFAWIRDPVNDLVVVGGQRVPASTGQPAVVAFVDPSFTPPELNAYVDGRLFDQVVGYAGAPDSAEWHRVEANEILLTPMWTHEYCTQLVALVEQINDWGRDLDDPVPGDEISLLTISPRLFAHVEADVGERIVPRLRRHWPEFGWSGLHDAFVLRYASEGEGPRSLALHHDLAQISGAVRLSHYSGGALEFPRQGYDTAGAAVGELVAWPSLVTHPHRAAPVTEGTKYSLTLWFRLPD